MTGSAIETTVPSMKTRLEPRMVAARTQGAEEALIRCGIRGVFETRVTAPPCRNFLRADHGPQRTQPGNRAADCRDSFVRILVIRDVRTVLSDAGGIHRRF